MKPVTVSSASSLESVVTATTSCTSSSLPLISVSKPKTKPCPLQTSNAPASVMPDATLSHPAPPSSVIPNEALPSEVEIPAADDQAQVPAPATNTVAEFLYQLTKLLTDGNREVIEWSDGRIEVHNPHKLANDVLHKYFRHSKYASFQRQLNYFGFRKLAGKGKMAPCSYINDATTVDLRSLLTIKRKTSTPRDRSGSKREGNASLKDSAKRTAAAASSSDASATTPVNPVLAGILHKTKSLGSKRARLGEDGAEAPAFRVAIGKGVKHQLNGYLKGPQASPSSPSNPSNPGDRSGTVPASAAGSGLSPPSPTGPATSAVQSTGLTFLDPPQLGMSIENCLSELTTNYQNTLKALEGDDRNSEVPSAEGASGMEAVVSGGMLSRNSSLVDLAMLPSLDSVDPTPVSELSSGTFNFLDFPHQDDFAPASSGADDGS